MRRRADDGQAAERGTGATLFGVLFLVDVYPVLSRAISCSLAFCGVFFVVYSVLTSVRPRASYFLGLVPAAPARTAAWSQQACLQLTENGDIAATAAIMVGDGRRGDPSWPSPPASCPQGGAPGWPDARSQA